MIAICGDQPFFSTDDWFIGTREMNAGIPEAIRGDDAEVSLQRPREPRKLFDAYPGADCMRRDGGGGGNCRLQAGYLEQVKELCEQRGRGADF